MANRYYRKRTGNRGSSAARVSRKTARKIVRRAGPMDRRFFMDSTMSDPSLPAPTIYANNTGTQLVSEHLIIQTTDYQDELVAQERIQMGKIRIELLLRGNPCAAAATWGAHRSLCFMLVAGRPDDIQGEFVTQLTNPSATQSQAFAYQELNRRSMRILVRKTILIWHPPALTSVSNTETQLSAANYRASIKRVVLQTKRRFTMEEPEEVRLYVNTHVPSRPAGNDANTGIVNGHHIVQATWRRY